MGLIWRDRYSIVLEVPNKELLPDARHNHLIRVWALASLATDAGGWLLRDVRLTIYRVEWEIGEAHSHTDEA